jgi:hypothetical protein
VVKKVPYSKIDLSFNKIARVRDLDEFAEILFPGNRKHQEMFMAIFVELKYAEGAFLPSLTLVCDKYGFSHRRLETVRAKMRRMGLIDHVSRFNKRYGYREGWVISNRFCNALTHLAAIPAEFLKRKDAGQERKDRFLLMDPK